MGAYGGREEIMNVVAPLGPVYQAGTLSGNPLAMAAGYAQLDHLLVNHKKYYKHLEAMGALLESEVMSHATEKNYPVTYNRCGSMATLFLPHRRFTPGKKRASATRKTFRNTSGN